MADLEIAYDPISVISTSTNGVAITGLNDIKLAVTQPIETKSGVTLSVPDAIKTETKLTVSVPETIKTDGKLAFAVTEPIVTDSKAAIDLQPVVLDQCLKITLGPLPVTQICFPNRQRIGLTLFGVEVFGLTLDGEAQILVGDPPKPPRVVAAPVNRPPHAPHIVHAPAAPASATLTSATGSSGLVIKLGG